MREHTIPILSFFTGGGFLDLGFERAGFQTVWCNEYNQDFADMFEYGMSALRNKGRVNKPGVVVNSRSSIADLRPDKVRIGAFDGACPDCFGIIGGPPCPDFSSGGKHKGHEGDHGKLSKTYIDMVCSLRPGFFLMENVPGLIRYQKHRSFFDSLRAQAHESGFATDFAVLNALEFGAPQVRNRVFLIGISHKIWKSLRPHQPMPMSDGWFPFPKPSHPDAQLYAWPKTTKLGTKPDKPKGIPRELMAIHWLENAGIESGLPNADECFLPRSQKFFSVFEGDDSRKSFKRLHRYRYSPTACYGNNEVHLHPWEPRRLSVREALRIQTVPDGYVLPRDKPLSAKFKMIANGVPVVLAQAVARSIGEFLNSSTQMRANAKNHATHRK